MLATLAQFSFFVFADRCLIINHNFNSVTHVAAVLIQCVIDQERQNPRQLQILVAQQLLPIITLTKFSL